MLCNRVAHSLMLFLSYIYIYILYLDHISRDPLCAGFAGCPAFCTFFLCVSLGSHVSHEFFPREREKIRDATHTQKGGRKRKEKKGYICYMCVSNKAQGHIHSTQRQEEFLSVTPRDQLFR